MGIFNKKAANNEDNGKFIGAWLPLPVNEYIELYSVATGISKSQIVLEQLTAFKIIKSENNRSENDLIKMLAKTAIVNFKTNAYKKVSLTTFCNNVKAELRRKKLTVSIINRIIKQVQNGAK